MRIFLGFQNWISSVSLLRSQAAMFLPVTDEPETLAGCHRTQTQKTLLKTSLPRQVPFELRSLKTCAARQPQKLEQFLTEDCSDQSLEGDERLWKWVS